MSPTRRGLLLLAIVAPAGSFALEAMPLARRRHRK